MENRIDSIFYEKLGSELNLKRQKLGYSFRYLSKLTGISSAQLDDYLNGKNRIKKEVYELICGALEIDPHINIEITLGR